MKDVFENAMINIINFETPDVITASGGEKQNDSKFEEEFSA